jgi:hypothetical protein
LQGHRLQTRRVGAQFVADHRQSRVSHLFAARHYVLAGHQPFGVRDRHEPGVLVSCP